MTSPYRRPYLDSAVFISWLKDSDDGPLADGTIGDRRPVSEFVLQQAENGLYRVVTSHGTMAEVFKKKGDGNVVLTDDQNGRIVQYFENPWIDWVPLEWLVGQDANALLVKYRDEKLRPFDAIHLASALRAKCDVLLTWDGPLRRIKHPAIRIEFPQTFQLPPSPPQPVRLFEDMDE